MAEVKVIYLPSGKGGRKQGVDDYLAAGHDVDDLLALTTEVLREPITGEEAREDPETQSAFLVRCAEEADLFRTPDDEAFVTFVVDEDRVRRETHRVRSKTTKLWLQRRFYREHNKPPGAQALQEALDVLESKARFDGEER